MKVSVILPTYKRLAFLAASLPSVINQSYPDWECIVINDDPESRREIDEYTRSLGDARVRVIHNPQNLHIARSRNKGMAAASGDIISFLDDDDIWLPDHLAQVVARFQARPDAGLVYSGYVCHWEGEANKKLENKALPPPPDAFMAMLRGEFTFPLASIVSVRRACLDTTGDFDPQANSLEDWDLFTRIAKRFPIDYVKAATVIWRIHFGERLSTNTKIRLQALKKLESRWGSYPEFSQFSNRLVVNLYYSDFKRALLSARNKMPFSLVAECVRKCGIKNAYNAKIIGKMLLLVVLGRFAPGRYA